MLPCAEGVVWVEGGRSARRAQRNHENASAYPRHSDSVSAWQASAGDEHFCPASLRAGLERHTSNAGTLCHGSVSLSNWFSSPSTTKGCIYAYPWQWARARNHAYWGLNLSSATLGGQFLHHPKSRRCSHAVEAKGCLGSHRSHKAKADPPPPPYQGGVWRRLSKCIGSCSH